MSCMSSSTCGRRHARFSAKATRRPKSGWASDFWRCSVVAARSGGHTIRCWASRRMLDASALAAVDSACDYIAGRTRTRLMNYAHALHDGLPIATGVIEGARRYVVRIAWTARALTDAEAVLRLRLRAVRSSGDFDAYWAFHLAQENQRNHVARYEDGAVSNPLPAPKPRLRRVK